MQGHPVHWFQQASFRTLAMLFAALSLVAGAASAQGQRVESAAEALQFEQAFGRSVTEADVRDAPAALKRAVPADYLRTPLTDLDRAVSVELRAPTAEEVRLELGQPSRGPLKLGFNRGVEGLDTPAALKRRLQWRPASEGGSSALLVLSSPEARAVRLGLRIESLPPGLELRFFDDQLENMHFVPGEEVATRVARNLVAGDPEEVARVYWSPVIEGPGVTLELWVPAGVDPAAVGLSVVGLSHLAASPRTGSGFEDLRKIGEGASCNVDISCPAGTGWGNVSNATARMVYTTPGGSFLCSGTLLGDALGSQTAYFLSANHCISTQSVASTLQTYWFYRATACNVLSLNPSSVTLTGGATLLYQTAFTDIALFFLNQVAPVGAFANGWSTQPLSLGTAVTGVHHPGGDLQKISTGSVNLFCVRSGPNFVCSSVISSSLSHYNVPFTSGTVEPGSSGSGLFRNDTKQLVGQIEATAPFSANPNVFCPNAGVNLYGRFDLAYADGSLGVWLNPPATTLTALTNGITVFNQSGAPGTARYYYIDVPAGQGLLNVATIGGTGNVDVFVRRVSYPTRFSNECASATGTNAESCSIANPTSGRYYVLLSSEVAFANVQLVASFAPAGDTVPNAFFFSQQSPVPLSSVRTSEPVFPVGYAASTSISVSNGTYSIGCTGTFTSAAGTISPGQAVCLRHTAAATSSTATTTTVTVGGVAGTFQSVTATGLFIPPTSLTPAQFGVPYNQNIVAQGGIAPYAFSVLSGTLPTGITLSSEGVLSGTTTVTGSFPFTVQVTDQSGQSSTANLTLLVVDITPDTFGFTSQTNVPLSSVRTSNTITPTGYTNQTSVTVSNGLVSINCSGSFVSSPVNLSPGQSICVRHTSAATPATNTVTTLTIGGVSGTFTSTTAAALSITTASPLPGGVLNSPYSQSLAAGGGLAPFSFSVFSGALPLGITLASSGALAGTPIQTGVFNFTVRLQDGSGQIADKPFALTILDPVPDAFTFTAQANVALGSVRTSNSITPTGFNTGAAISVSNGSYSIGCTTTFVTAPGTLNPGQSVCLRHTSAATPATNTVTTLTIGGVNGTFTSTTAAALSITTASPLPGGVLGSPYSQSLAAGGGLAPFSFSVFSGALPLGITLASSGALTGTPIQDGVFNFTVRLQDGSGQTADKPFALTIFNPAPDAFTFTPQANVALGSVRTSNSITPTGFNTDAAISVTNGSYSIGCTTSFVTAPATIAPGQSVCVRHTAAATPSTTVTTTLTISGVSGQFSSTTASGAPSWTAVAAGSTAIASASNAAPTVVATLNAVCPADGLLLVTASGESTAVSGNAGTAFIGLAYSIARDSTATDNGNVVQSSALAVFNGDANRDFLAVQRVDACTPGATSTYRLTAYRTTPDTSTASFVWNGRLTAVASRSAAGSGFAAGTTSIASASSATPTIVATLAATCPASGQLLVTGSGESAAQSSNPSTAFIGLAYSISRDSTSTDNGNVVQSSALARFNGDANRDFLNVQRADICTPGLSYTYRLTAYRTTADTSASSFVWNGRLVATDLASAPAAGFAPGTTAAASSSSATPTIVTSLAVTCPASGSVLVTGSGESAAVSTNAGSAFIGLAYSIARDSTATDNSNVVQSSALATFSGDANRDFLNVQRVDACTPGQSSTYRLTVYRSTGDTGPASFVWNGRLTAVALPVAPI